MQVSQPVPSSFGSHTVKQMPALKSSVSQPTDLGIEVIDKIVWQGWEPGKEYTKNIVLKNVKVKTQKIKYK